MRRNYGFPLVLGALALAGLALSPGPPAAGGTTGGAHPVLALKDVDPGNGMLLGGALGGKWTEQGKLAKQLRGGEKYQLYSLTGRLAEAAGGKPSGGEPMPDQMFVKITPAPKAREGAIAVAGSWNALPRTPQARSPRQAVYRDAVAAFLRGKGLTRPAINLTQVLRIDLEGDGKEEVLLSATTPNLDYSRARKNDYTLVLLRKISAGGMVKNLLVDGTFSPTAGGQMSGGNRVRIAGVLDLNGDGVQEIITEWEGYEEYGYDVYTVRGGVVKKVLSAGLGA